MNKEKIQITPIPEFKGVELSIFDTPPIIDWQSFETVSRVTPRLTPIIIEKTTQNIQKTSFHSQVIILSIFKPIISICKANNILKAMTTYIRENIYKIKKIHTISQNLRLIQIHTFSNGIQEENN